MRRSLKASLAAVGALTLALGACSPSTDNGNNSNSGGTASSSSGDNGSGEQTTVTFRLWDDVAAPAYEDSFAKFEEQNPDINVEVEVVPWATYWEQLPLDISSGDAADIYWLNAAYFAQYADNGNLMDITAELGEDHDEWQQSVVDLYTRDGKLWGVPQIWDSIALYYNQDLVEEAGVDPANLTWAPGGGEDDTLLPALQKLTKDADGNTADSADFDANNVETYGYNAQADLQAIYLDYLAQNGGQFQDDEDNFAFASPEGVEAFQYVVDLIHEHNVAPPATETNTNGDITRDMFVRGDLALYQSGPYNLKTIAENTDINWGIAPIVGGPEGDHSVVHGVVAVGNAATQNKEATVRVLEWLGSAEGQTPLAEQGVSFPAAVDAQPAFVNYWSEQGVDVSPFIDAASGDIADQLTGTNALAGNQAIQPAILDTFLGSVSVEEGLKAAQDAGNEAMANN